MRNKAFLILIALCGLLMAATFGLWAYCSKLKSEKERLDGNQTALLEKVEFYQTESGKSAASVQALTLSKSEVEKHCADLTNTVKELDLKVKRLQAASTTATKTEVEVQTIVTKVPSGNCKGKRRDGKAHFHANRHRYVPEYHARREYHPAVLP